MKSRSKKRTPNIVNVQRGKIAYARAERVRRIYCDRLSQRAAYNWSVSTERYVTYCTD
jgi:hypothetical protein